MATKYVQTSCNLETASALYTAASGGSTTTYADGDTVVINAGQTLTITADHSTDTIGMAGLTITGVASGTPAMLTFASSGTCVLKMASNTTIAGTNTTVRGRIMSGGGTWGSPAALAQSVLHGIMMGGTTTPAQINATYLDQQHFCLWPTIPYARTYGQLVTVASISGNFVTTSTMPSPAWANGTVIRFNSATASYPTGIVPNVDYLISGYTGHGTYCTFNLTQFSGSPTITLGTSWTGTLQGYDGCASGATALNVLDDVTGDPTWTTVAGWNYTCLANDPQTQSITRTTLSTITSSAITVGNALGSAQRPGAQLWLGSRNVQLICPAGTASSTAIVDWTTSTFGGSTLQCFVGNVAGSVTGTTNYGYGINKGGSVGSGHTLRISAYGNYLGLNYCTGCNCTSASFVGNYYGLNSCTGCNCTSASFVGNDYGLYSCTGCNCTSASFVGNYFGLYSCTGEIGNAVFSGNNQDIFMSGYSITGHGATLGSSTQVTSYLTATDPASSYMQTCIYDISGIAGRVGVWMPGGIVKSVASGWSGTPPSPVQSFYHNHNPVGQSGSSTSVFCPNFLDFPITGIAGTPITVTLWLQKDGNSWKETPVASLVDMAHGFDTGAAVLATTTMADNTSWQTLTLTYTPTYNQQIKLRVECMNGSGNLWWNYAVNYPNYFSF